MSIRTEARMFEEAGLVKLAESHPVNQVIASIGSHETEAVRLLRINGPRARMLCEEMDREALEKHEAPQSRWCDGGGVIGYRPSPSS